MTLGTSAGREGSDAVDGISVRVLGALEAWLSPLSTNGFPSARVAALCYVAAITLVLATSIIEHWMLLIVSGFVFLVFAFRDTASAGRPSARAADEPASVASAPAEPRSTGPAPSPLPFLSLAGATTARVLERGLPLPAAVRQARHTEGAARDALSALMARMNHDIRTPLNAVIGFSDAMSAELLGPLGNPRYRDYARHIRDCGREFLRSAEDALTITSILSRADVDTVGQVGLGALIDDAWQGAAVRLGTYSAVLNLRLPASLPLAGDRNTLRQALTNVFEEAARRAGSEGTVTVSASVDGDLVQLEIGAGVPGNSERPGEPSLPICVARTLLALEGASLVEIDESTCAWRVVTVLPCAAQPDFFDAFEMRPTLGEAKPTYVC